MAKEIERKFLVTPQDWSKQPDVQVRHITQGYISKSVKHTVRIRVLVDATSPTTCYEAYVTIKGPKHGITRAEYEYEVPYEDGVELLQMCDGNLIEKTRYTFLHKKKQCWEVDVFHGTHEGLTVAEIELDSELTEVIYPHWVLLPEVTHDRRFTNSYLSAHVIKS
jgi:adenylate cyclase